MRTVFIAACFIVTGLGAADAQLIDVATGNGSTVPTGGAVLGGAGDQWNVFDASGGGSYGPLSLIDSHGTATAATYSFICQGAVAAASSPSQPDPDLTHYYMFNNSRGPLSGIVTGLDPLQSYRIVMYVASDDASNGDRSIMGELVGSSIDNFTATGNPQSTFINGQNIVDLTANPTATGNLAFLLQDGPNNSSGEVDMSGFQLEAVPEPASLAALGLGLACLLARRKR